MTLQELKQSLETNTFKPTTFILVSADKFIPLQYVEEIKKNYNVIYIESLNDLSPKEYDIFEDNTKISTDILIFNTEIVDFSEDMLFNRDDVIIIANKIDKASKKFYGDLVIEIPQLADWQVKDMVYSFGKGVDTKYLDCLIHNCGGDVNRLYNEMSKLMMFPEKERNRIFEDMISDGAFNDLSSSTVFNFTNAILKKDFNSLKEIYEEIDNIDISEFGLLTILYNNFLNVVNVQMGINPTAESLGLKQNQFNAIKYNCGYYSSASLINIMQFLTNIDYRIKTGNLDTKIMLDYIVMSILSF